MKLIIGLGNPGTKYEKTRHNIGFMVLDQFLKDFESVKDTTWEDNKKLKSDIVQIEWNRQHKYKKGDVERVILAKPKTYMNNSGMAVGLLMNFYQVDPSDVWVIHDDVDLRLGALRIREGGGSAGHRGIESILATIPEGNFWRFRLGIGRPEEMANVKGVDTFVLGTFTHEEHGKIRELLHHTSKSLQEALEEGMEYSMNRYNTK